MGKVKSWAWDCAEEQVDDIIKSYVKGDITKDVAVQDISKVQNLDLIGIDEYNIEDVLYYAVEDNKKKEMAMA